MNQYSKEILLAKLQLHSIWLNSEGKYGEQLKFGKTGWTSFRNLDLSGADFTGAEFLDCNFDGATLKDVVGLTDSAQYVNCTFKNVTGVRVRQALELLDVPVANDNAEGAAEGTDGAAKS